MKRFIRPYRLHLGCGKVRLPGWLNIDVDATLSTVDIVCNLSTGIPIRDASCQLIFSEHLLEHMPADRGVEFLRECRRVLQPGGVVRIAMPSLDVILDKAAGDWRDQDWLRWPEYAFIQTRAEMLNIAFRWWGHQWLYDREELHRRLKEAGFARIGDVSHGESSIAELRGRETRLDSLLICEAVRT
jgi:predicted SAM-dependent methyltransferase